MIARLWTTALWMIALVDNDGNSPDEGANGGTCLLGSLFHGIKFGLKTFTLGLELGTLTIHKLQFAFFASELTVAFSF